MTCVFGYRSILHYIISFPYKVTPIVRYYFRWHPVSADDVLLYEFMTAFAFNTTYDLSLTHLVK